MHPRAIVDDLRRQSRVASAETEAQVNLFTDFNGLPSEDARTEFYQHDAHWSNRMILEDNLQVRASLAERERLRGKVQCIYLDPHTESNSIQIFPWSTTSRDVKDENVDHITREPEQVKAFRDAWRDGIHSYPTYLRDRLTVARDLLADSGSVFVQFGSENAHRIRALLDEVFGDVNFVSEVSFKTTGGAGSPSGGTETLALVNDYLLWYAKRIETAKYRQAYRAKNDSAGGTSAYKKLDFFGVLARRKASEAERSSIPKGARLFRFDNLTSQSSGTPQFFEVAFEEKLIATGKSGWKTTKPGMNRLIVSDRVGLAGNTLSYIRYIEDFPVFH